MRLDVGDNTAGDSSTPEGTPVGAARSRGDNVAATSTFSDATCGSAGFSLALLLDDPLRLAAVICFRSSIRPAFTAAQISLCCLLTRSLSAVSAVAVSYGSRLLARMVPR